MPNKTLKLYEPSVLEVSVYFEVDGKEFAARIIFDGKDNPSEKRIRETCESFSHAVVRTLVNKKVLRTHKDKCECLRCWDKIQYARIMKASGRSL